MDKNKGLEELAKEISSCTRCSLYKKANKAVPGEGKPDAKLMLIGESPGYWEDQRGIPFCGAAGNLLDQLLQLIKLKRKEVFIGNMVKHRPPDNREPLPEELEACQPFLDRQIKIIDPEVIVTLGRFSMNRFLPGEYISRVHGQPRLIRFAGKTKIIVPMFHPAAALRRGEIMKQIRADFEKLPEILENNASSKHSSRFSLHQGISECENKMNKENVVQLKVFDLDDK